MREDVDGTPVCLYWLVPRPHATASCVLSLRENRCAAAGRTFFPKLDSLRTVWGRSGAGLHSIQKLKNSGPFMCHGTPRKKGWGEGLTKSGDCSEQRRVPDGKRNQGSAARPAAQVGEAVLVGALAAGAGQRPRLLPSIHLAASERAPGRRQEAASHETAAEPWPCSAAALSSDKDCRAPARAFVCLSVCQEPQPPSRALGKKVPRVCLAGQAGASTGRRASSRHQGLSSQCPPLPAHLIVVVLLGRGGKAAHAPVRRPLWTDRETRRACRQAQRVDSRRLHDRWATCLVAQQHLADAAVEGQFPLPAGPHLAGEARGRLLAKADSQPGLAEEAVRSTAKQRTAPRGGGCRAKPKPLVSKGPRFFDSRETGRTVASRNNMGTPAVKQSLQRVDGTVRAQRSLPTACC
jgi:hypothetical protein